MVRERVYYTIEVRDKGGQLVSRERRKSHSFVQQWNELICLQAGQKADLSIKDTGGTDRDCDKHSANLDMAAPIADISEGIVVGRGSTAVAIDDYVLETICGEGVGANQLNYQACTVADAAVAGSSSSFTVTRSAINNSGATITVTEIGIYVTGIYNVTTVATMLGIRDILSSSQAVPDGGSITVVYTIKVTV